MVIEAKTLVGAAGAFAVVGGVLWASALLLEPPQPDPSLKHGAVEVRQINEPSWAVEVRELGALDKPAEATRTAAR